MSLAATPGMPAANSSELTEDTEDTEDHRLDLRSHLSENTSAVFFSGKRTPVA